MHLVVYYINNKLYAFFVYIIICTKEEIRKQKGIVSNIEVREKEDVRYRRTYDSHKIATLFEYNSSISISSFVYTQNSNFKNTANNDVTCLKINYTIYDCGVKFFFLSLTFML